MERDRPYASVDAHGIRPPARYELHADLAPSGTTVLALVGEFDMAAADALRDRLAELSGGGVPYAVVDLAGVEFMDSSTLRELLRADMAFRRGGGRLIAASPPPPVARLFELTRATELLTVVESLPEAFRRAAA